MADEPETNDAAADEEAEAAAAPQEEPAAESEAPAAENEAPTAEDAADEAKPEGDKADEAKPEAEGEGSSEGGERKKPRTAEDIFLELEGGDDAEKPKVLKVHTGIVHVYATFNNTIVSVSDVNGNVIGWSSSGKMGFRGSRKSTAYAAQLVSQDACRQAMGHGLKQAEVRVKGPGGGRESAVRAVQALGIEVTKIKDVTPVPPNGCRPKKARRV